MMEQLKKTMLAAVGAGVITAEMVEARLNEFVKRGKLSGEEARRVAENIAAESRKEYEASRGRISELADEMMRRANFATQRQHDALVARVTRLEQAAHAQESKPAAEPAPAKKS